MLMLWLLVLLKNSGVSFFQLHVPRAYDEDHRDRGWPFHNAKRSCEYFFLLFLATNIHSCWLKTLFHYAKRSREYFLAIYPNIHSYWLKTCIVSLCFTVQSVRVSIYSSLLFAISSRSFLLTQNIVFSTNKCQRSSLWGSGTSWLLQGSNLAPRIHSGFCSKPLKIIVKIVSNASDNQIPEILVTTNYAKQIKPLLRLKTGLHQATLTLAEPLQGPQVGKWKQWNVCD